MAGFERSEWISKPPSEVYAFVTDPARAPQVVKGVTHMEKITDGPVGVGTQFRETRVVNGEEATAVLDVVACEPGEKYAVAAETSGVTVTYHYAFKPEKEGTRVDLVCDVSASGLKKAMVPLVVAIMKKEDGDHLEHLKTVMESTGGVRGFG